jgi:p-aminobenzoyl-glutamate transporter AbgT
MNKFLIRLPLVYVAASFVVAVSSWICEYYGCGVHSILCADGIRWLVENLIPNIKQSPLAEILFLLISLSVVVESGLLKVLSGNLSPKQRRSMHLTICVFFLYMLLLAILSLPPSSILLSAFGTFSDSSLSKGAFAIVVIGLLLLGNFYGYVSGRFTTYDDFILAHTERLKSSLSLILTIITASQFVAFVNYTFGELTPNLGFFLSLIVYYIPTLLHLLGWKIRIFRTVK